MPTDVDVCVATYKRPQLLARLLESLQQQTARAKRTLRVIVIDNDAEGSAREVATTFRIASGMDLIYAIEPNQGISFARNRALRQVRAPLAAFLDDDEQASPEWLETIVAALEHYEADIAFGPVVGLLPDAAPTWARAHPSFLRPRFPTGQVISLGGAGNVLFRTRVFNGKLALFSEQYARTGGEDTELFGRFHAAGFKLIWCDEAVVSEHVPPERTTLGWVCLRAFRGGQTYYRIFVAKRSFVARLKWLGKRLAAVLVSVPALPVLAIFGSSALVIHLTRMCGWLGQLSQCAGQRFQYEEYQGKPRG